MRGAQLAVWALFFSNGLVFSSLLPRLPEIKAALGLDDAAFGLLVVCFPVGAVLLAGAAGAVIRTVGPLVAAVAGTLLVAVLLASAGAVVSGAAAVGAGAPGDAGAHTGGGVGAAALLVGLILAAAGSIDAVVDAAQNVRALDVQRLLGRTIIGSAHAVWSLGAAAGGVVGAFAAGVGLRLDAHLTISGTVATAAAVAAAPFLRLPAGAASAPAGASPLTADAAAAPAADAVPSVNATAGPEAPRPAGAVRLALAAAVVIAVCGLVIEDVANGWVPLFLQRETGFGAQGAGIGFAVVLLAQCAGRIAGDRVTDVIGAVRLIRIAGVAIALGALLVVAAPQAALIGFALCGLGSGPLVPTAFAAADALPGLRKGTGVTVVGWLMRAGFLASPLIGVISEGAGLRAGMLLPVAAGLGACLLASLAFASADGALGHRGLPKGRSER